MYQKVKIENTTCIGCGLCEKVCSKKILNCDDGKAKVLSFDNWGCCGCGLCMSVCPTQSITVSGINYANMPPMPKSNVTYTDLKKMALSRRSIRSFSDKKVEEDVLKKITELSALAPIGSPPTNVNVRILQEKEDLDKIYNATVTGWKKLIKSIKNPIYRFILKQVAGKNKYYALINHALPAAKIYCDFADKGKDVFTFKAPVIILFYGNKPGVCITENCWLSTSYAIAASHALELGTTVSGMIPPIINMNKSIKSELGIPKNQEIYSCLMLGYPNKNIQFKRTIPRKLNSVK